MIATLGLAMKDFSNDDRLSPAIQVVEILQKRGYRVRGFDPAVATYYPYKASSLEDCCAGANCILVLAKQHGITAEAVLDKAERAAPGCTIIDTRNLIPGTAGQSARTKVIRI